MAPQDLNARFADFAADLDAAQMDAPHLPVLDALFAQIQSEQKFLQRRYLAVVELRGAAWRLAREGLPVTLSAAGDVLTLSVPLPGLAAFVEVMPGEGARPAAASPSEISVSVAEAVLPSALRAQVEAPAPVVSAPAAADTPVPAPEAAPAQNAVIAARLGDLRRSGLHLSAAIRVVSEEFSVSIRGLESRLHRGMRAMLEADLAANPIPADINAAAALVDPRGKFTRETRWTGVDDARFLEGIVQRIAGGMSKMQAVHAAALDMGRTAKAGEARLFNVLAERLEVKLGDLGPRDAAPRKVPGGKVNGWTEEETAKLVQLVADGICAGLPKRDAIRDAALQIDRPFEGAQFRVLNKAKAALAAELARRAGSAAKAAPTATELPPVPPAACVQDVAAGDGGAPPPPPNPPVATNALATNAVTTGKKTLQVAPEPVAQPAPEGVKQSLTPAAPKPPGPRPSGRETQVAAPVDLAPVTAHLRALTKGDAKVLQRDFALIHLACAGWELPTIAVDLGMDSKAVKQQFEALCGYDPATKKGRFPRSYVYHGLEALLKLKAVA